MPKPRILFWLSALGILSVALLVAACGSSGEPELPDTTSASVLAYLEEVDYQNNDDWKLWPGTEEKYQGDDPHGMLLTTYLNPAAFEAVEKSATTPDGSIIVKENYTLPATTPPTLSCTKSRATTPTIATGFGSRFWPMARWRRKAEWKAASSATGMSQTTFGDRSSRRLTGSGPLGDKSGADAATLYTSAP